MAYDSADFTMRQEEFAGEAGGAGTTEYCKFRRFQKSKLVAVHGVATVAGTTTAHGFDVFHGTSSIGTISLGTGAANTLASSAVLNETLAAGDQVSVKSKADTAGKAHIIFEYETETDAVMS